MSSPKFSYTLTRSTGKPSESQLVRLNGGGEMVECCVSLISEAYPTAVRSQSPV